MESTINKLIEDPYNYSKNLSVSKLEEIIKFTSDKFFNDESIISDSVYDLLIDFLRYKDPKNKTLKTIGSKIKSKNKVKLDYHLGSMDKIKPPSTQLEKWLTKYPETPYILSEKLDGVSGLLTYKKNGDIKLHTRGTATHGVDITPIVKYITKIPSFERMKKYISKNKIKDSTYSDNIIAFRGELIISKNIFNSEWASSKSNSRNTVSGLVNSKNLDPILAGSTHFVVYEVVDPELTLLEQFKIAKEIGFRTVHFKKLDEINYNILSEYLKKRKSRSKYLIDGIIVSNNMLHIRNTEGNPDYAFAFKDIFEDQKAISTIEKLEWNISKDGYINPIVIIKPVEIGGVTISRITAYNAKYVVDNKLGKGAKIQLIRSGDVIPKILEVLEPASKTELPDGKWEWTSTKVDIISTDENSREKDIKNIYFFFSSLDTKGMGEKIVEKIYDSGLKSILDIVKATKNDFIKIDGFKDKSSDNLVESIKLSLTGNSNGIELENLMAASNQLGHGLGSKRCKLILENIPNLLTEYEKWSDNEFTDKIKEIPGWDDKTSQQFVKNFPKFIEFYNNIKDYVKFKNKTSKKKKSKLNGKIIVLSGFRDKEFEELLKEMDVKIANSVSKNTNILIVKNEEVLEDKTGKVKKADELNITIITKDNFKQSYLI
jgi:DNA ligase (NAD+)